MDSRQLHECSLINLLFLRAASDWHVGDSCEILMVADGDLEGGFVHRLVEAWERLASGDSFELC